MSLPTDLRTITAPAWTIIGGLFFVGLGNYMVVPFFALYLTKELGLTLVDAATALTVSLWAQRGLSLFGGMFSDRYGARRAMVAGLLFRFVSYTGLSMSSTFPEILLWTTLMGAGAALYAPAGKAALVSLSCSENRVLLFSLRNTSHNIGVALGPAIGIAGAAYSYKLTLLTAGILFLCFAAVTQLLVPPTKPREETQIDLRGMLSLFFDRKLVLLGAVMFFFFGIYSQLELTMPVFAAAHYSKVAAGLIFTINAAAVILLQMPLSGWTARTSPSVTIGIGMVGFGIGFAILAVEAGLASFLLGVFIFTLGEIIVEPKVDSEVGRAIPASSLGSAYGLMSLLAAFGGTLGNYAGSIGLEVAERGALGGTFWLAFAVFSFIVAGVCFAVIARVLK